MHKCYNCLMEDITESVNCFCGCEFKGDIDKIVSYLQFLAKQTEKKDLMKICVDCENNSTINCNECFEFNEIRKEDNHERYRKHF